MSHQHFTGAISKNNKGEFDAFCFFTQGCGKMIRVPERFTDGLANALNNCWPFMKVMSYARQLNTRTLLQIAFAAHFAGDTSRWESFKFKETTWKNCSNFELQLRLWNVLTQFPRLQFGIVNKSVAWQVQLIILWFKRLNFLFLCEGISSVPSFPPSAPQNKHWLRIHLALAQLNIQLNTAETEAFTSVSPTSRPVAHWMLLTNRCSGSWHPLRPILVNYHLALTWPRHSFI